MRFGVARVAGVDWARRGSPALVDALSSRAAIHLRGSLDERRTRDWTRRVYRARRTWNDDFGGEQYAIGRAFYTHFETDRSALYFSDAGTSDQRVERALPGLQAWMLELLGRMTGGIVKRRLGFCGAGVHIFPAGEKVARAGGVVHYDVEGLSPLSLDRRQRALSLVVMLQPPVRGGGLRLYDAEYCGKEEPSPRDLASVHCLLRYAPGDAMLMSSYRLHQIRPFQGDVDRVSATLHAVEIDWNVWETWF